MIEDASAARQARESQEVIQREMAYTNYAQSCADAHITPEGELRECRRAKQHQPPHASGYGTRHRQWTDQTNTESPSSDNPEGQ